MKSMYQILFVLALAVSLSAAPAAKKPAGGLAGRGGVAPGAPQFSATFSKLFGENKSFSAVMNTEVAQARGNERFTTPCKVAFLNGKSRMEVDLTQSKGSNIPAGMADHLKAMGMSEMVIVSLPAKDISYLVYPALQSYAEIASANGKPVDESKLKVDIRQLGKETVEGHSCVKNKVMIMDQGGGKPEEATVWNATDMKNFPVRIETADENATATMTFTQVKFETPPAKLFEPPSNFKRYTNFQAMLQEIMMKRMQGGTMPK